jgi:hypothetical protein
MWCRLEHLDLLLTSLRFIFFAQITIYVFFEDFWLALRTLIHIHCTKKSDFFEFFFEFLIQLETIIRLQKCFVPMSQPFILHRVTA